MKKLAVTFLPILFAGFVFVNNDSPISGNKAMDQKQYDGPYVLYRKDKVFLKYVMENNGLNTVKIDSMPLSAKAGLSFNVSTDEPGKTFAVHLKNKLQVEKSEYKKVNKLLAVSDIEGNFEAFRKLLQSSGVIDANFNWTFGDGNLVLVGDFFDRGDQVTEVLWLIYSLEDKAKAAGGYVHFVLGNHEIMNLSGDLRYLNQKYVQDTILLDEDYVKDLYGENSELGRWLRTKNVVEKIGGLLFLHGGISAEMNGMDISVTRINDLARPYYPDSTYIYNDKKLDTIYSDSGPFWYRGYYKSKTQVAATSQIDSTLQKFYVKHIVTGHTIVADTISLWHNGKLIDLDVHHAEGKSEALYIEDDKYYRINGKGEKVLLMD